MGYKRIQYIRWIKNIKAIYTYRKIRFPVKPFSSPEQEPNNDQQDV
jgi:hypothetical protein